MAGHRRFRTVNAGNAQSCGVTFARKAFCWGVDAFGALGDGMTDTFHPSPVLVGNGLALIEVRAGISPHSCGLAPDGRAYCWGYNVDGQLGDGTRIDRLIPVAVAGPM